MLRLIKVRSRVAWISRGYMPNRSSAAVLAKLRCTLGRLEDEPPAKTADLAPLRRMIAALLVEISAYLQGGGDG